MGGIETFRITDENKACVSEVCEKRGDKTKIYNDALSEYFLKRSDIPEAKPKEKKTAVVEL